MMMPPRWFTRSVSLLAAVVLLVAAAALFWVYGPRTWSPWAMLLWTCSIFASVFWTRPSKTRTIVQRIVLIAAGITLLSCTAAYFGSGGDTTSKGDIHAETARILLCGVWCMAIGLVFVRASALLLRRSTKNQPPSL